MDENREEVAVGTETVNWATKLKFNYPRTALIGLAFFAISLFWQAYYYVVPLMLKYDYGVNDSVINIILMAENILAVFMLPLIGMLSDKTNTRIGRRMPFILICSIVAAVFFALTAIGNGTKNFPLVMTLLFLSVFAMSCFRSPAVALMPDLTPKPLRSKGNAIINITGTIGGIIGMGLAGVLVFSENIKDADGLTVPGQVDYAGTSPWFFIIVAVIMIAAVVALFFFIREKKVKAKMEEECKKSGYDEAAEEEKIKERDKNISMTKGKMISLILILSSIFLWFMAYSAVITAASRYAYEVWKTDQGSIAMIVAQAVAVAGAIPASFLAGKIGRKWTIMIGIVILICGLLGLMLLKTFSPVLFIFFGLVGLGWIVININSYPMVVELARGPNVGKYTGFYYMASMASQMVTKFISGILLDQVGYHFLFPYAIAFCAAALITMFFVLHGDGADKKMKLRTSKVN